MTKITHKHSRTCKAGHPLTVDAFRTPRMKEWLLTGDIESKRIFIRTKREGREVVFPITVLAPVCPTCGTDKVRWCLPVTDTETQWGTTRTEFT